MEEAKRLLSNSPGVVILESDGRNFLVEADEQQLRSVLPDPNEWAVSAESFTPAPPVPHPVIKRLRPKGGRGG